MIGLLEPATVSPPNQTTCKPITKKEACAILNINYNTTRLKKIIDEYKEHEEFVTRRKADNRGKRASSTEIIQVITEYLEGEPVAEIAKRLFRSSGFVVGIVKRVGVPRRPVGDRKTFDFLPEACICSSFQPNQIVWSAKYHSAAIVVKQLEDERYEQDYGSECYQISIIERIDSSDSYFKHIESGGFNAFALAYDIGSLEHLKEYGIDLKNIS